MKIVIGRIPDSRVIETYKFFVNSHGTIANFDPVYLLAGDIDDLAYTLRTANFIKQFINDRHLKKLITKKYSEEIIMSEMIDPILVCLYCGDSMDMPNEKQIKIFGFPKCCDEDMLHLERNKLFKIIGALDTLKAKLEKEMLRGLV